MIPIRRLAFIAAAMIGAAACAAPATARAPAVRGGDRYLIVREELAAHGARNMRDVINSVRPDWLQGPRTGSGLGGTASAPPVVYLDGRPLGDTDALRSVSTNSVERACYYNLSTAQDRFGSVVRTPVVELVTLGRNIDGRRC